MSDREQGVSADLLEQQLRWVADPANGVASLTVYVEPADCRAILAALEDAARLRAWFRANWGDVRDGCDIDGGDWQDRAEAAGLLVRVPASDDVRADYDMDTMLVPWYAAQAAEGDAP
jgi:hypothetical protein